MNNEEIYKKTFAYLFIKSSQILRSVKKEDRWKDKNYAEKLKLEVLDEVLKLFKKIDDGNLRNEDIRSAILKILEKYNKYIKENEKRLSFGEIQKMINVPIKYYFLIRKGLDSHIKEQLDCPLDSIILRKKLKKEIEKGENKKLYKRLESELKKRNLNFSNLKLIDIDKELYETIQEIISKLRDSKIEFDLEWDYYKLKTLEGDKNE